MNDLDPTPHPPRIFRSGGTVNVDAVWRRSRDAAVGDRRVRGARAPIESCAHM